MYRLLNESFELILSDVLRTVFNKWLRVASSLVVLDMGTKRASKHTPLNSSRSKGSMTQDGEGENHKAERIYTTK